MISDGVDMYDLLPYIPQIGKTLKPLDEIFWVGVVEGMSPSPPIPRKKTNCYTSAKVYLFEEFDKKVFAMVSDYKTGKLDYYYIPKSEYNFIQPSRKG